MKALQATKWLALTDRLKLTCRQEEEKSKAKVSESI
jgi:hypothetical protein